jgi:hypothetical protein
MTGVQQMRPIIESQQAMAGKTSAAHALDIMGRATRPALPSPEQIQAIVDNATARTR